MQESGKLGYIFENLNSGASKTSFLSQLLKKGDIPKEFAVTATYFLKSEFFPEDEYEIEPEKRFLFFFKRRKSIEKPINGSIKDKIEDRWQVRLLTKYAVLANLPNEAILACESFNLFYEAGEIAEKFGLKKETKRLYKTYIDEKMRSNKEGWHFARDLAKEKGLLEKAVEMYEVGAAIESSDAAKARRLEDGGNFAIKNGLPRLAQEMYIKSSEMYEKEAEQCCNYSYSRFSSFNEALRMAKKAEDNQKLRVLFMKVQDLLLNDEFNRYNPRAEDTIRADAKRYGLIEEIINLDEKKGNYESAGDTSKEYNQTERARRLYKKAIKAEKNMGDFLHALDIAKKAGLEDEIQLLSSLQSVLS